MLWMITRLDVLPLVISSVANYSSTQIILLVDVQAPNLIG
jgi:hypothetical protein